MYWTNGEKCCVTSERDMDWKETERKQPCEHQSEEKEVPQAPERFPCRENHGKQVCSLQPMKEQAGSDIHTAPCEGLNANKGDMPWRKMQTVESSHWGRLLDASMPHGKKPPVKWVSDVSQVIASENNKKVNFSWFLERPSKWNFLYFHSCLMPISLHWLQVRKA